MTNKIGFGGGCHWCTEAVFQSLKGVTKVEQGWIAAVGNEEDFSEGVIVHFDKSQMELSVLISIHLHTHSCTSNHKMRTKYRSAIYCFSPEQVLQAQEIIVQSQKEFENPIITQVLDFSSFKENQEQYQNYFMKNSENQFCQNYINPKFQILRKKYSKHYKELKLV